jgi:hypothetical protein
VPVFGDGQQAKQTRQKGSLAAAKFGGTSDGAIAAVIVPATLVAPTWTNLT